MLQSFHSQALKVPLPRNFDFGKHCGFSGVFADGQEEDERGLVGGWRGSVREIEGIHQNLNNLKLQSVSQTLSSLLPPLIRPFPPPCIPKSKLLGSGSFRTMSADSFSALGNGNFVALTQPAAVGILMGSPNCPGGWTAIGTA